MNTNTSLSASLLKPMVPSSVVGMSARGGHRGRLVRHSVHVAISYRLSVVAEDSRRWPHPFSEVLTPTFGTQPRDECLYFGVLGLQLRGVVGAVAPPAHLVLLGRLLALLLLRADALLLPAPLLVLALTGLVLRLLHAT